ncbi:MAG: RNA polymerase sigma-D factor [Chlamydiales bacterium]|nr:RNA polymerase sigma-D factor [Chlamydiales bacterium]MCH9620228.1 RNA polymerase sigma-D factor [Chlamydiales bacterium]MCH9623057.1 RNA polymerase sigma-D factor [Chlamydiales bacterium]
MAEIALEELWKKYRSTLKTEYRDELIVHHLHLVKFVVGRIGSTYPSHVKIDDLYSSGVTGLIKAIEKYDPDRRVKFASYAILLIKGAIIDELRELDWIPRSIHQKSNLIAKAQEKLQKQLGREPNDEEMALHLGMSQEEFKGVLDRIRPAVLVPLNGEGHSEEGNVPLAERIPDTRIKTASEIAHRKENAKLLEKEIAMLCDQEQKVLMLYYYEDLMLKEIGKVLGVSESRVSQIHTKALLKLKHRFQSTFAHQFLN